MWEINIFIYVSVIRTFYLNTRLLIYLYYILYSNQNNNYNLINLIRKPVK